MLRGKLIHPEILEALGRAGHGSKILIADGNYPFSTGSNPRAKQVYLNLSPGLVSATQVLQVLAQVISIEAAHVMGKEGDEPTIFKDFREILPDTIELQPLERFAFYDSSREANVALVIATGEERTYANILLTIGVIQG
jgi:L-fucose mutarotase